MKKSRWPAEKTAQLLALVDEGLCRREIAARMGLIINAVTTKLFTLGLEVSLNPAGYQPPAARASSGGLVHLTRFPRFEDVTRAEAAAISAGAPRSATYGHECDYSLIGNAAEMCTRI